MRNLRKSGVFIGLTIMVAALRLVFADCDAFYWGCANAGVGVVGGPWARSGGCPASHSSGGKPAIITTKCQVCEVYAGGVAATVTPSIDPVTGFCFLTSTRVNGSSTIDLGGTGCEMIQINDGCGGTYYRIWGAQHNGTITVTATVSGDCASCPPNTSDCSLCTITVATWKAEVSIKVELDPNAPCNSGRCTASGAPNQNAPNQHIASTGSLLNDSVNFSLHLGAASCDQDAGYLSLYSELPSTNLSQPIALQPPFGRTNVIVLTNSSGEIKQVKTPQGLVNIAVKDAYEYYLQCFYDSSLARDGSGNYVLDGNNFYTTNAAAYNIWTVKNPDGASQSNRLWITEQRDGTTRTFQYTFNSTNRRWDLLQPDGLTTISTWRIPDANDSSITNCFTVVSNGVTTFRKTQKTYQYVAALGTTILLQEIEGDAGLFRTNSYNYYPGNAANPGDANRLQRVDYSSGDWRYYKHDQFGRVTNEFSAWQTNSPPANVTTEPNVATDVFKLTEYAYTLTLANDGIDDNTRLSMGSPRRTIVKLPSGGVLREVSRVYKVYEGDPGGFDGLGSTALTEYSQVCLTPGGKWNDTGNLMTTTVTTGDGKPSSVTNPDGTYVQLYYVQDPDSGYLTTVAYDGRTRTTTIVDELGLIQSKVAVDTYYNVTVQSETYNYKDGGGNYFDPLRRSCDVTDLAGRKTQYRYNSCCGLDYYIDPDGVKTYQVQDVLMKWPLGTKSAIETIAGTERLLLVTNVVDGVGAVLVTKRVGTNGSIITLAQNQYDVLGRLIRQTNALNNVITNLYALTNGRPLEVILNPDGGTRTNTYYRDGQLENVTGTATYGLRYVYGIEQDGTDWRQYSKTIKLDTNNVETAEWTKTYLDPIGRSYKTLFSATNAPYPSEQTYYDLYGRVSKRVDADGVATLYTYNGQGELEFTAVDVNTNDTIDFDGADRITQQERLVLPASGDKPDLVQRNTYAWNDGQSIGTLISRAETSADGLKTWQIAYADASHATTNTTCSVYAAGGARYLTNTSPDSSYTLTTYSYGRMASTAKMDANNSQIAKTTFGYDPHNRRNTQTDARNGATTYAFDNGDQITSVTTPAPVYYQSAQTTWNYYDKMARTTNVIAPDGGSVTNEYLLTGLLKKTYGSRTYPVEYTYDYAGRMSTMKTWQNFAAGSGSALTTWNYDGCRGWLTNKLYADSTGPNYSYTAGGRLKTRTWARIGTSSQRIVTTYSYGFDDAATDNQHGDLTGVSYANDPLSTPAITTVYDRRGRASTTAQGGMTTANTYNDANQPLVESYSGGILTGLAVTNGYDQFLRRTNLSVLNASSAALARTAYGYDAASRLITVGDGGSTAVYSYLANSPLVGNVWFTNNTTLRMTTTKTYDFLNRLTSVVSSNAQLPTPVAYSYSYNAANQRALNTTGDGSYWRYEYDALGQVTRGAKFFSDGNPVPGQQFEYVHDDIGNRTSTKAGGDERGAALRSASYTVNTLNQYSQRDVPGAVDVLGLVLGPNGSPTVNSLTPWRKGEYFRKELPVVNSSSAVWTAINVTATGLGSVSGNVFTPKTPELFAYDKDGNLTNDGRWTYYWDAENRIVKQESLTSAPAGSKLRLEFAYDAKSRRIQKLVSTNNGSAYVAQYTNRFVYDGWNPAANLNPQSAVLQAFTWGLDLSGSLQGAGGVGGLLFNRDTASGTTNYVAYDGNGNVAALVKANDGTPSANYEYSPFGELIRTTGTMAKANPFRFSTKYQDDESDFLYYGYRSFNPSSGRWLNRDPMGERGGRNLYGFVAINPLSRIDALGLYAFDMEVKVYIEGTRVTFGGRTFNTGTKVDHVVHVDTDTDSITQSKFIGTTIEYDSSGNEIGSGTAPSTGLTASIKCKLTKTRFGCCKQCDVNMSGSAADPLFHGFAPGIDYEFQLIVTVCPGATALSYFGSHDGYPSYDFSVAGANVHHYSHVTAGTSPLSLYPSTKGIYFGSTLWLMTGL